MPDAADTFCVPPSPHQATSSDSLRLWAPAKINLNLLVGAIRTDGYHPVDSCIAKITMYDNIDLHRRDDGKITLVCEGISCGPAEENLAYRSAMLLADGKPGRGVDIRLMKNIPPGGGLGGGSSDAASVLAGLNELWNLHLSNEQLRERAAELGSDVPLFLGPAACHATGRGEVLEPLDVFPFRAVLILPGLHCATREVYRAFDAAPTPQDKQLSASIFRQPPSQWRDRLVNHLAEPAYSVCPPLAELHQRLTGALPIPVHLTGSGSSLFVLCDDQAEAQRAMEMIPADVKHRCRIVQKNAW